MSAYGMRIEQRGQVHDEFELHRSGSEAVGCRIRSHHLIVLRLGELGMRDQLTPLFPGDIARK